MTNRRSLGKNREFAACDYLEGEGYRIIVQNYRCRFGEVDIIADDGGYLVFAEVKYRASSAAGFPQEAVTCGKQRAIGNVAKHYMMTRSLPFDTPVRFDVVAILGDEITLIKNAFGFLG